VVEAEPATPAQIGAGLVEVVVKAGVGVFRAFVLDDFENVGGETGGFVLHINAPGKECSLDEAKRHPGY
jgi:hypothetical protein